MAQASTQHNSPAKRGPGRRTNADKGLDRRCARLETSVTLTEKQAVRDQAKRAGLTEAEYVRRSVLGKRVVVRQSKADAQLVHEVNMVGVNLMQFLRDDRFGRGTRTEADWDGLYARLSGMLDQLVDALDD